MKDTSKLFSRLSARGIGRLRLRLSFLVLLACCASATAQTTAFTYQGKLADNGSPPNGNYDFQFSLFDSLSGGGQLGTTQTATNILVTNGTFAITLDFVNCLGCACPTCFNGGARFLEITVKPTGGGSFTLLTPRQPITSTPYAVKSVSAATADGLSVACVSCVTSSQIATVNGSAVTGAIPLGSVPPGSPNYIQNTTSPQPSSNFNISSNGTADIFNAATQFNIGGNRVLSTGGTNNLFAGQGAGNVNTGSSNALFGRDAGRSNASGSSNSFFGAGAGFNNDDGSNNAFFGTGAGGNSFGGLANANTFIGSSAGAANTTGRSNTMIGFQADAPFPSTLINSTAIGFRAFVTQGNSLVLGSISGINNAAADTNVGIGTTAPSQRLHVVGNGLFTGNLTVNGTLNAALPTGSGNYIQNGTSAQASSNFNISGTGVIGGKLGVGSAAPGYKLEVIDPGSNGLRVQTNGTGGAVASFGGNGAFNIDGPGFGGGRFTVLENGNVGIGASNPADKFLISGTDVIRARINSDSNAGIAFSLSNQPKWSVATVFGGHLHIYNEAINALALSINSANNNMAVNGTLDVNGNVSLLLGSGGSDSVCQNSSARLATCGSSVRYKQNINSFASGLSLVNRLRPVSFNWKADNKTDFGLVAEEVADVEPLLVTRNEKGEAEGVKYDRVGVVLINAVKEQQQQIEGQQHQIEAQQKQIYEQQKLIEALRFLVCEGNPQARLCK